MAGAERSRRLAARTGQPARHPGRAALLLLALAATAACGTTVPLAGQQLVGAPPAGGNGLGPAAGAGPGNTAPTGTGTGAAAGAGAVGGGLTATSGGSAVAVSGAGSASAGAPTVAGGSGPVGPAGSGGVHRDAAGVLQGPGVSATTITIGMGFDTNGDAANAAIGASGIQKGDVVGEAKAVLADINARGGAAHRRLVPVFHGYDAQSTQTNDTQDVAACSDYTQDHHVFAVADLGLTESLTACLARAGVLQTWSGDIIDHDADFFHRYPHFSDLGTLSQDRMMAELPRALVRQHYFDGWNSATSGPAPGAPAKVGVLSVDTPDWNTPLAGTLLPALSAAGHPVPSNDVIRVRPAKTTSEIGAQAADIQNAALRFRNDQVTHVVLLDASGVLSLFFTKNAQGQHYFPRYGVNSGTGMQALVDAGDIDKAQLKGAVGTGWLPQLDLSQGAARKYLTPSATHCLAVMAKAGFTFSGANDRSIAFQTCDQLYLLAASINAAGSSVVLTAVQAAIDRIGAGFVPADLPAAFLSSSQHDAVSTGYDLAWNDGCGCAVYTDNGHRVP